MHESLPPEVFARRREELAPLFAYMREQGFVALRLARRVGLRHGIVISRGRLHQIKLGGCVAPVGFVEEMCAEIGRPVEEIMGGAWYHEFRPALLLATTVAAERPEKKAS